MACDPCNKRKGALSVEEFGIPHVRAAAGLPLKDAAAVNSTRWALWSALKTLDLPLEPGTGGLTKKNRHEQGYPKAHWIDAACVGLSGAKVDIDPLLNALQVGCQSKHSIRMCLPDRHGFPRSKAKGQSRLNGFSTGDLVRAVVPSGKRKGKHLGRIAVRSSGYFRVGKADGISFKHCTIIQKADGYSYNPDPALSAQPTRGGVSSAPLS